MFVEELVELETDPLLPLLARSPFVVSFTSVLLLCDFLLFLLSLIFPILRGHHCGVSGATSFAALCKAQL